MKNLTILIILITISIITIHAQDTPDSILIKKQTGTVFIQNGRNLTPKQLLNITQVNPEAFKEMQTAKTNYNFALVFGSAGGFMVGYPLGTALGGGNPNWILAGIGAGLIIVAIPLATSYTKHASKAVGIYNSGLKEASANKIDLRLCLTGNGIGLRATF